MLPMESLPFQSILKTLHVFIGKQFEKIIDFLLTKLFFDDFHINDLS
jgi:hypothetical protein